MSLNGSTEAFRLRYKRFKKAIAPHIILSVVTFCSTLHMMVSAASPAA
jgi:hypothetical protein